MRVTSDDGIEIELHDLGGDGPPLVISHATGFLGAVYRPMAAALTDRFRVWAVDYRGHGDSTARPDGDQDWNGMTRDLLACLDAIGGTEPVVGFGHSMGGAVTLDAERRRPGSFRAVVAYEPIVPPARPPSPVPEANDHMAGPASRRRPGFASRADALLRYAARPPLDVFRADVLYRYVEDGFADDGEGGVRLKCTPALEAATFRGAGAITQPDLAGIEVPTLVMAGATETALPPGQFAPRVADALRNAEFVSYPTLGHFGPFQDPLRITLDLRAFVERVLGSH